MATFVHSVQQSLQVNSLHINSYQIEQLKKHEKAPLINSTQQTHAGYSSTISSSSYRHQTSKAHGVSWAVATFLLVNTALGAGMLHYPYAYNQVGGILPACLTQIFLLILIAATMFILIYCADLNRVNNYHDVLLSMCGKRAQQASAISILLTCYGINVTFLVIIGDQYDRIFTSLIENHTNFWYLDRKFTIFITSVVFIWPMCYAKRLDFLKHASILGMFSMLYVAFLTIYQYIVLDLNTYNAKTTAETKPAALIAENVSSKNESQLPTTVAWFEPLAVIPILCFAYQTHEVIVPVYACMKKRNTWEFMKSTIVSLLLLFLVYNIVGAFGYVTFGANVGADIMTLYDGKDPIVVVGIVALVIKFITTYPSLMFCGRGALEGLYGEFKQMDVTQYEASEKSRRFLITTIWFTSTVMLAVFAPDISVTLQLLGSIASINVFVFPGMCLISLTRQLQGMRFISKAALHVFAALLILAGILIFVLEIVFVYFN